MTGLQTIAIPTKVADLVRTTMKAPGYGHPAHKEVTGGYGPCRHCLKTFCVGQEERILFTYDPFHELSPYPLPGPIFIHANNCVRHPDDGGFPEDLRAHALTVIGYGDERMVQSKEYVVNGDIETVARRMFREASIRFLHIRDTVAGCYDCRIE